MVEAPSPRKRYQMVENSLIDSTVVAVTAWVSSTPSYVMLLTASVRSPATIATISRSDPEATVKLDNVTLKLPELLLEFSTTAPPLSTMTAASAGAAKAARRPRAEAAAKVKVVVINRIVRLLD